MAALPLTALFLKSFTFIDDDGQPLASGRIYSYEAGSTTPQTLYTDSDGQIAASNPYDLNSEGRPDDTLFMANTGYKIIVTTEDGPDSPTPVPPSNVILSTDDNIEAVGAVVFSTLANTLAAGSRDVVSGYVVTDDDNTVTVYPAGSPDPCIINLPAAADRGLPLTIINKGTTVDVEVTCDGADTINSVSSTLTLPASTTPTFSGVTLNSDGVSDWLMSAYWAT